MRKTSLDVVVREYEWSVWEGRWIVVSSRVIKANPDDRWRTCRG